MLMNKKKRDKNRKSYRKHIKITVNLKNVTNNYIIKDKNRIMKYKI